MLLSTAAPACAQSRASSQREAAALKAAFRPVNPLTGKVAASRSAACSRAATVVRAAAATVDAVRPAAVANVDKANQKPTVIITGESFVNTSR